jgi:ABC-2 type transport system permease protein
MSNKTFLIIKREYLTKVKKKSFIIMTILAPFLFVGIGVLIAFLGKYNKEFKHVIVLDESGVFQDVLKSDEDVNYEYLKGIDLTDAIDGFQKNNYYALIHIPKLADNSLENLAKNVNLYTFEGSSISFENNVSKVLESKLRKLKLVELGTSLETVNQANIDVKIKQLDFRGNQKNSKEGIIKIVIGSFGGILIYMFIFMYGVQVMRSVIEEKTNRIVEIIISSVKPFHLMMGKIIGAASVGLTQFILWIVLSLILFSVASTFFGFDASPAAANLANTNIPADVAQSELTGVLNALMDINFAVILGAFVFYFLAGYLMYSALFAAIGSAVDSETDTQQFMLPITLPLIIALYSGFTIIENPHGPVAFWMSMIPLTSPVVMMARIPFDVPTWQILLSAFLLILGFVFTGYLAGKIYRTGILMYGKKPTYKELFKWLKY